MEFLASAASEQPSRLPNRRRHGTHLNSQRFKLLGKHGLLAIGKGCFGAVVDADYGAGTDPSRYGPPA